MKKLEKILKKLNKNVIEKLFKIKNQNKDS